MYHVISSSPQCTSFGVVTNYIKFKINDVIGYFIKIVGCKVLLRLINVHKALIGVCNFWHATNKSIFSCVLSLTHSFVIITSSYAFAHWLELSTERKQMRTKSMIYIFPLLQKQYFS